MSEQRLIDIDALKEKEQYVPCGKGLLFHGVTAATIDAMPTIDPETLPIVRELREKLERVTAERDSYKIFFNDITKCGDCNDCGESATCEFVPKVGQTTRYNCTLWTGR